MQRAYIANSSASRQFKSDRGPKIDQLITNAVEKTQYREAMSRFAGAVHVATTDGEAGRRGVTVTAACSVSDDPPTVLICLNHRNPSNECFAANGVYAINILSADHGEISRAFSGMGDLSQDDRFALGNWDELVTGAPALKGALATFDCRIENSVVAGTHTILIGRVAALRIGDKAKPLLYHDRDYHAL